jgi:hypothetical protein
MAQFYVVVRHELTPADRAALEPLGCVIVAESGPAGSAPVAEAPIPPELHQTLEASPGYVVGVPAESESDAIGRVAAAGIDDAAIWRDFSAGALP